MDDLDRQIRDSMTEDLEASIARAGLKPGYKFTKAYASYDMELTDPDGTTTHTCTTSFDFPPTGGKTVAEISSAPLWDGSASDLVATVWASAGGSVSRIDLAHVGVRLATGENVEVRILPANRRHRDE